jgi:post-segregation antitoxin (ccd killing protein)
MNKKVSTCLYIDRGILETARNAGLNLSKVAENALVDAIGRLCGQKQASSASRLHLLRDGAGI